MALPIVNPNIPNANPVPPVTNNIVYPEYQIPQGKPPVEKDNSRMYFAVVVVVLIIGFYMLYKKK